MQREVFPGKEGGSLRLNVFSGQLKALAQLTRSTSGPQYVLC